MKFEIQLAKNGATSSAKIVADGSGLVPSGATGEYPASLTTHTASQFQVTIGGITVGASEENLLGSDATLQFDLVASGAGVGEQLIEGTGTCTISRPGAPHLDRTISGTFVLARSPGSASTEEVELN